MWEEMREKKSRGKLVEATDDLKEKHKSCIEHLPAVCCLNDEGLVSAVVGTTYFVELKEKCRLLPLAKNSPALDKFLDVNLNSCVLHERKKSTDESFLHLRSRHLLYYRYPVSDAYEERQPIFREFVANGYVLWTDKWPDYCPPEFNYEQEEGGISYSDGAIKCIEDSTWFAFNSTDQQINSKTKTSTPVRVDRLSVLGRYKFDELGRPLNPMGRTGLRGKGLLPLWGPNKIIQYLITRESKQEVSGYDFVGFYSKKMMRWMFPEVMLYEDTGVVPDMIVGKMAMELVCKRAGGDQNISKQDLDATMRRSAGSLFYSGYLDDPRNTDNAWIETMAINIHDDLCVLANFDLDDKGDDGYDCEPRVVWIGKDEKRLFTSCKDLLVAFEAKRLRRV